MAAEGGSEHQIHTSSLSLFCAHETRESFCLSLCRSLCSSRLVPTRSLSCARAHTIWNSLNGLRDEIAYISVCMCVCENYCVSSFESFTGRVGIAKIKMSMSYTLTIWNRIQTITQIKIVHNTPHTSKSTKLPQLVCSALNPGHKDEPTQRSLSHIKHTHRHSNVRTRICNSASSAFHAFRYSVRKNQTRTN